MATAFETFVTTELPQRPTMLTLASTSYFAIHGSLREAA